MSQLEKLLLRIKNNPKTVRFDELDKILKRLDFEVRQPKGGSSIIFILKVISFCVYQSIILILNRFMWKR